MSDKKTLQHLEKVMTVKMKTMPILKKQGPPQKLGMAK